MDMDMSTERPEFEHYKITELPSSGPQPRSKASAHNRAMSGSIMQAPRPEQRDVDGSVVGSDGQQIHGWAQKYTDSDGNLSVALDCGMCFKDVPQRQVFDGTADLTCDIAHRKRDDDTYNSLRTVATITVKGAVQSEES